MKFDPGPPAVLFSSTFLAALAIGWMALPWPFLVLAAIITGLWVENRWIRLEPAAQS